MVNIFKYIKKNGIKRTLNVIYCYKLDKMINYIVRYFTKKIELKDIIVIESHDDFDCNGGAFYDYLIENHYNEKYKIIWVLKHKCTRELPYNVNSFLLHRPSIKKSYYLSLAKYLTADNEVTVKARDEQISIYFDHGSVCLKNCKPFFDMSEKKIDYFFSPSPNYDKIYCNQMSIPYPNNKMVYLGYPRHDIFYNESQNELKKITDKKYEKVFLWMPTFRKGGGYNRNDSKVELPLGIPLIENEKMMLELQRKLLLKNQLLIIKIHPKQDPTSVIRLKKIGYSNILILDEEEIKLRNIDCFKLLKNVDALISDYSSITYSFILLNKPIGYVFSDINDFKLGFAMENYQDYVVGPRIYNLDELLRFFDGVGESDTYKEKREKVRDWLYKYQDGNSCKRIVEFLDL